MKLITELNEEVKYLVEEAGPGKKNVFIEGIFMQTNRGNRNGRLYRKETIEREVNRYMKESISKNRAYGELGHPSGPTINLDRVCMMIKDLRFEGNDVIGRAKVMDTPMGNIVKNLISEGASLGVSSRGLGSVQKNKDGLMEVQDDFFLATAADIVADPSAPDAFVQGIMEGVEWVWNNGMLKPQKIEELKNQVVKASSHELQETKIRVFENFLHSLAKKTTL